MKSNRNLDKRDLKVGSGKSNCLWTLGQCGHLISSFSVTVKSYVRIVEWKWRYTESLAVGREIATSTRKSLAVLLMTQRVYRVLGQAGVNSDRSEWMVRMLDHGG